MLELIYCCIKLFEGSILVVLIHFFSYFDTIANCLNGTMVPVVFVSFFFTNSTYRVTGIYAMNS